MGHRHFCVANKNSILSFDNKIQLISGLIQVISQYNGLAGQMGFNFQQEQGFLFTTAS
jgi:hypothetical protein